MARPLLILGLVVLALVAVAGLVLAVGLLVPVWVRAQGTFTQARVDALATASWGGGLVRARATPHEGMVVRLGGLAVYRVRAADFVREDAAPESRAPRDRKQGWRIRWRTGRRIVARVLRSMRLRTAVRGRIGAGDPADTALVFGVLASTRAWLPRLDTRGLTVDWLEPAVDVEGEVHGRIWPAAIAWILITEFARGR